MTMARARLFFFRAAKLQTMPATVYTPYHWTTTSLFSEADLPYDVVAKTGLPGLEGVVGMNVPAAYQAHGEAGLCWVTGPRGQPFQECDNYLSYNNVAPDGTIIKNALTAFSTNDSGFERSKGGAPPSSPPLREPKPKLTQRSVWSALVLTVLFAFFLLFLIRWV